MGKMDEAMVAYEKASLIWELLALESPEDTALAIRLSGTHINRGFIATDREQFANAETCFGDGIKVLTDALARTPADLYGREYLRNAYYGRAVLMGKINRHQDAVGDFERALQYDTGDMAARIKQLRDEAAEKAKPSDPDGSQR